MGKSCEEEKMGKHSLLLCLALGLAWAAFSGVATVAADSGKAKIVSTTRNISDGYWAEWHEGGKEAAAALGFDYQMISADDNETKQFSDLESAIAAGIDALVVMPMNNAVLPSIVEMAEANKVLIVTMWDRPADLDPDDYEYWVAHVTQDTVKQGYDNAVTLFKGIGGKGDVVVLDGTYGTEAADLRMKGRLQALKEFPGIKVLATQNGEYNRVKSMALTEDFLANFGEEIDGIWGGTDEMALAAAEVVKNSGLSGKIKISGIDTVADAVQAILDGEMYCTLGGDGKGMHGTGCMIAFDAVNGVRPARGDKIVYWNPAIVTSENVKEYYENNVVNYKPHPWREMSRTYGK
jgi:ribose transport system substrate-binding protein